MSKTCLVCDLHSPFTTIPTAVKAVFDFMLMMMLSFHLSLPLNNTVRIRIALAATPAFAEKPAGLIVLLFLAFIAVVILMRYS